MSKPLKTSRKMQVQFGRALIQPSTINIETREVDVVFATETPVERWGWEETYNEVLKCEESAMRRGRADKGLPVLDCHSGYSVEHQFGRSTKHWISDDKEAWARLKLSSSPKATQLFQDIQDGIVTDISVGYRVFKFERNDAEDGEIPTYRAVDWEPYEISFVPVPADPNSGVRSGGANEHNVEIITKTTINKKTMATKANKKSIKRRSAESGTTVDYTVEGEAVKLGDIITLEDGTQGVALADGDVGEDITLTLIEAQPAEGDEGTGADDGERKINAAISTAVAKAKQDERAQATLDAQKRMKDIRMSTTAAGLDDSVAVEFFSSDKAIDVCRHEIIERAIAKQGTPAKGNHGITVGAEAIDKKRLAAQNAILHRIMPGTFKLDDVARQYRGMTLIELGKEMLNERGINTRGLDKMAVASHFFGRSISTSDFPLLFEGVIDKMLRADYTYAPEYWDKIARQTSVADFKPKNFYEVDSINGMKEIKEGAEIKYTTLVEGKQSIRVRSYAEGIKFTRQAFINDDLGAFSIIPSKFIKDWDELRGDEIWALIVDNVKMGDGKTLFHADHGNLLTGASSALTETSLAAAKVAMSKQKSIGGRNARILPSYLIVSPELEVAAMKLLSTITPTRTSDVNVFANQFNIIVEPRIVNATEWYISADPNAVDTLSYAYLEGSETLRVNSEDDFNTDTQKYAIRGDFGVAAIDHRGLVKANGK